MSLMTRLLAREPGSAVAEPAENVRSPPDPPFRAALHRATPLRNTHTELLDARR